MLENPILLKIKAVVLKRCPYAFVLGGSFAANTFLFTRERRYLKGRLPTPCELPSVLYFALIRSGSQYVNGLITELYTKAGGESLKLQNYIFHGRLKDMLRLRELDFLSTLIKPRGFYYGPIAPPNTAFGSDDYRVVVGIRDPRDIMVSFFYSLAYAHVPSDAKFVRDSREARENGLEWFVRQPLRIAAVRDDLTKVVADYWHDERVFRWKYEDMMDDFASFLDQLARYICGARYDQSVVDAMIGERDAQERAFAAKDSENVNAHRRSGKSGGFREKLTAESVAILNREFADILKVCEYPAE